MRYFILLILIDFAIIGCQPKDPLSQVVFVKANDVVVTAKEAKDAAEFLAQMQACTGKPIQEKKWTRWINRTAMKIVPSLVTAKLFEREFEKRGIVASDAAKEIVLARYRKMMRKPKATLDDVAHALGMYEGYFRKQFERESRLEQYLMNCEGIEPSAEDVEIAEAQIKKLIEKNTAEDAQAKMRGNEAWKCLQAGEPWDAVAKKYSEDKLLYGKDCDYAHEWETITPKYCYLKEIGDALPGMKAGDYTKPIETDEGLLIVRVLEVEKEAYKCVRILIRLKAKVELPGRDELKIRLENENREQAQLDLREEILKKTKIEYPLGTNFIYKVVQEPVKANRKVKKNEDKK